nr:hypothetical protein [Tanacetum cinerariifolium]
MIIVQKESVVDTSDLQTELERTKERFENCIIKKETEYAKLWNDWYKKCDECKYDKISYDKAYNDMHQKIERLQAQLGDLKVTSNSDSTPQESKSMNNDKVIAPGMFRINPSKNSREEKHMPNTVSASTRLKPITVSKPHVITKKDVNSDINCLSSTGVDNTKTRRPQPRSNTKNDRDVISKVVCAMCNKCLISVNHDECLRNYVNGKNSHGKKQKSKVSLNENQMKYQPKVTKPKKVGTLERLATPKPKKSRLLLRWSPTSRLFDQEGKIVKSSESESQYACSNGYNACTSNILEPKIKRFPNSTSGCSKHMTGNLKLLINFVWKFMGTVCFRNDHVAAILGLGDLQKPDISFLHVFGALCYPKNDHEDIGKLGAKGDIGYFIG